MTLEQLTLDARIDATHKAAQQAEQDALELIERLKRIPGTEALIRSKRSFGQLPNPWQTGNLSQQAAILRGDPALAAFLARRAGKDLPGTDAARMEAEARKQRSIELMQQQTEAMRQQRQQREAQRRHVEQWGRIDRFTGNRVFH